MGQPRQALCKNGHNMAETRIGLSGNTQCGVCKRANERTHVLAPHGINTQKYDELLSQQSFRCAICRNPPTDTGRSLAVDHCHTSAKVRGLLCVNCNTALGLLRDSEFNLESALMYLKKAGSHALS